MNSHPCNVCGRPTPVSVPAGLTPNFVVCPECGDAQTLAEGGAVVRLKDLPQGALMALGTVRITPGAVAALERAGVRAADLPARHARGDWGKAGHYDRTRVSDTEMRKGALATDKGNKLNKISVLNRRGQVLSVYPDVGGQEVWAVSTLDGDRAETCLMLRGEY